MPITVTEFDNIGSISLTLLYDTNVMTFITATANASFSGMIINGSTPGKVIIGWYAAPDAVTLPDGTELVNLEFNYISGSTSLSFDNSSNSGQECQYTDGNTTILNDTPSADYYNDGYVTDHAAPFTYAPTITGVSSGTVDVPITVDNFSNIGAIALAFDYDPYVISYTGFDANTVFGTSMIVGSTSSSGGKNKVSISWIAPVNSPSSLPDGSTIVTLHFTYDPSQSPVNSSLLTWLTDGNSCQYGDANYDPLYDVPYEDYYIDGVVAGQTAPKTYLPEITNATVSINIPVTVDDFQGISAIALKFEYDASVMTYDTYAVNTAFGGNLSLGNSVNGNVGTISIGYYGSAVTLPDQDFIVNISFTYTSGTTTLEWQTANGNDCQYGDASFISLWDKPYEDYYINGLVAGQVAPVISADSMIATPGDQINVPLKVWGFTDITSMSLTLNYDPGVLTYLGASPHPDIAGNFSEGSSNPGKLQLGWYTSGNPVSYQDESVIVYLNFTYNGGSTPLVWYDNGGSCEFSAGVPSVALYDEPAEDYYINGRVSDESSEPHFNYIWIGSTSNDWNNTENWSDTVVPDSTSVVYINSGVPLPAYWPFYTGNFTIGKQCRTLHLDDNTEMKVTGDMVIESGHALVSSESDSLKIGGIWKNSGRYEYGTGIVSFTGLNSDIPAGILPAKEVQNYLLSTTVASMVSITGGSAGPAGDDEHMDVNIGFSFNYAGADFTQVRLNTNGWVSLNLSGIDLTSNANVWMFTTANPVNVLAPWWDDLKADGSSDISYLTSGSAPNRVFTVEWNNMLTYNTGSAARISFQVKLYETSNKIEFCYGSVAAGNHSALESASIGIKGPLGGEGDFMEATSGTSYRAVTNLRSDTDWPSVNYLFTPPPDTVTFYKLDVAKNGILNIHTNIKIMGQTP